MNARLFAKRNASTVLTCLGGIGVVATSIMAAKAVPKALTLIEEAERGKGEELTKWEKVKVASPKYIPTVLVGATTMACIFGANVLSKRQQASLASAYAFLDQSYKKYRRKVVELYGEETHNEVVKAIAIEEANEVYMHASNFCTDCTQFLEEDYSEPVLFYAVYVNEEDDQRVEISFDGNRWIVYSETLSEQLDYYGHTYRSPIGITYEECEEFLNKIDELKDMWVD